MQQNYKLYLQKLGKFNEWERAQYREKSVVGKLREFEELFELTMLTETRIREREQARHLASLVAIQRRFKKALRH